MESSTGMTERLCRGEDGEIYPGKEIRHGGHVFARERACLTPFACQNSRKVRPVLWNTELDLCLKQFNHECFNVLRFVIRVRPLLLQKTLKGVAT